MKLLRIDSSARAASVTRQLTARAAEEWKKNHPDGEVIARDLSAIQIPPITDDWGATRIEASAMTPAQRSYLSTSDQLIEELRAADTIVIGAPMYNFSISSSLKAWIDQIVRIGKTLGTDPRDRAAFSRRKTSSSSRLAEAPMRRAPPERHSISRNPTFEASWDSSG
jgi:FMN-dependent NADH-azoreductase